MSAAAGRATTRPIDRPSEAETESIPPTAVECPWCRKGPGTTTTTLLMCGGCGRWFVVDDR